MPKSTKATLLSRVDNVLQLMLMGAQFPQIRQYALGKGWNVSDRQLRRYKKFAYQRMARSTKRKTEELRGRHLMQRQFLYARAIKDNDNRTALQALGDEAALLGLYPATKISTATASGRQALAASQPPPLGCGERLAKILNAQARGDHAELKLMEHISPIHAFPLHDTHWAESMLHITSLEYVNIQLDQLVLFLYLMNRADDKDDPNRSAMRSKILLACRFRAVDEAWQTFTQRVGVDGDFLVQGNYLGRMLELGRELMGAFLPTPEEFTLIFMDDEQPWEEMPSGAALAKKWYRRIARLLEEPAA